MLEAIRSAPARRSPSRPTSTGRARIGKEFAEALSERARAGVKVHVLLDWVGSGKMDDGAPRDDGSEPACEVRKYHPLRWYNLSRMNNRTHRKLLVVDGSVGFTGGVGIADEWLGHAQDERPLARLALPARGPGGRPDAGGLHGQLDEDGAARCFTARTTSRAWRRPARHSRRSSRARPGEGSESVRLMYLLSIASARQTHPDRRRLLRARRPVGGDARRRAQSAA